MPEDQIIKTGTIVDIAHSMHSGLSTLFIENEGKRERVFVEAGHGIRQFVACFGSFQNIIGREISYSVDGLGLMEGFTPLEEEHQS